MALSLPKAKTVLIEAKNMDGTPGDKIEITTKVGQTIPMLTVPSILSLIRNTSVDPATSIKENSRYVAEVKPEEEVIISQQDGTMGDLTQDPRALTADDVEILVKQISPEMKGKKYKNLEWDTNNNTVFDVLGRKMSSFMLVRRTRKNFRAVREMIAAAKAIQALIVATDANAVTFKTGAHYVASSLTTPDEAYNAFKDGINNFSRMGTPGAKTDLNKKYAHAEGIDKSDIFALLSPEFEALILAKAGVFASDKGNELFRKAKIKEILGVDTISHISLEADTNFVLITTGLNGTYGYEELEGGAKGNIVVDPDWSFGKRLDLKDTFTMGVVLPFQIYVHENS